MRFHLTPLASALLVISCSGGGDGAKPPTQPAAVLTSVTLTSAGQSLTVGGTLQVTAAPRDQSGNAISATVTWASSSPGVASVSGSGLVLAVTPGTTTITATATAGSVVVSSTTLITVSAPPVAVLTSVTVTAPATSIIAGNTTQLTASPRDQNGSAITATVSWTSSAPGVASVGASTGLVLGVAVGTATITASATAGAITVTQTLQINVTAVPPTPVLTSVTIAGAGTVGAGSQITLTATPRDQSGNPISATVTWSSNAASATVSPTTGLTTNVSGVTPGSATITASATAGSITTTATKPITVTGGFPATASVTAGAFNSFNPSSVDISVGGSVSFTFEALHNVTFNSATGAPNDISDTPTGTVARTFSLAGTFNYVCTLHPGMAGAVVVH